VADINFKKNNMLSKSQVKYIQTLGQKKFRDEEGLFIAEGPKIIKDLLEEKTVTIKAIYALKDWIDDNRKTVGATEVIEITTIDLEKISQLKTPNKVVAIVQQFDVAKEITTSNKITLVLDGIQDPGNLGTIIRIADWFGVGQIVCSNDSADIYNSKVVQSTMGSIARVKVFYTDLEQWLREQKGISIYATTLEGKNIGSVGKIKEGIIIFGNESKGISQEVLNNCTDKITITKKGKAESLNAGVAAGIILSHLVYH
jgi:TrmH family RNA methyltransferase